MRKHLILTMAAGLAACGDSSGDDEESTLTDPTTDTGMTMTSPDDDATDAEASMTSPDDDGGSTSSGTGMPTTDPDSSTGEPSDLVAFRISGFALRDPHMKLENDDITINAINAPLNNAITMDATNDMFLDFSTLWMFRPLDQADQAMGEFYLVNAQCTAPVDTTTCDSYPGTTATFTMYTVTSTGPCMTPVAEELSDYPVAPEPPTGTPGPCFQSAPSEFSLRTPFFTVPMTDVLVGAQMIGDPADSLMFGNIHGFVSSADADATMVISPMTGALPMSDLLDPDDMDGDGWRLHFAFQAVPTTWSGPDN
jgi:hypothetical protein